MAGGDLVLVCDCTHTGQGIVIGCRNCMRLAGLSLPPSGPVLRRGRGLLLLLLPQQRHPPRQPRLHRHGRLRRLLLPRLPAPPRRPRLHRHPPLSAGCFGLPPLLFTPRTTGHRQPLLPLLLLPHLRRLPRQPRLHRRRRCSCHSSLSPPLERAPLHASLCEQAPSSTALPSPPSPSPPASPSPRQHPRCEQRLFTPVPDSRPDLPRQDRLLLLHLPRLRRDPRRGRAPPPPSSRDRREERRFTVARRL